jgi:hypothetical protein
MLYGTRQFNKSEVAMVVQCCVCKKVRQQSGIWIRTNLSAEAARETSHGYCPRCAETAFSEIRLRVQARQQQLAANPA